MFCKCSSDSIKASWIPTKKFLLGTLEKQDRKTLKTQHGNFKRVQPARHEKKFSNDLITDIVATLWPPKIGAFFGNFVAGKCKTKYTKTREK